MKEVAFMAKLTDKQKVFVDEYLIDMNATRAYKVAYPSVTKDETAMAAASRMLRNVKVQEKIAERMKDREIRTELTQDKVLKELAAIAFANGSDFAKVVKKENEFGEEYQDVELELTDKLTVEKKKAIAGIKMGKNGIEVNTCDKVKALELLGRHLGMWNDKLQVNNEAEAEKAKKLDNIESILEQMQPVESVENEKT